MAAFDALKQYLERVLKALEGGTQVDAELLEQCGSQVTDALDDSQRKSLLALLAELLIHPHQQHDPKPITDLIDRIVRPASFTFASALEGLFSSPQDPFERLQIGLLSHAPPLMLTILGVLSKAQNELTDLNQVAAHRDVVDSLVLVWLTEDATVVGQVAEDVLVDFLLFTRDGGPPRNFIDFATHENLMWRRVFTDRDIYERMFSTCSHAHTEDNLGKRRKTIAQGRLLHFLLRVRNSPVRTSSISEIEKKYGVTGGGGLTEFALRHMVDPEEDDLMLTTLLNHCRQYIGDTSTTDDTGEPLALSLLVKYGVHARCMSYYLAPSEDTMSFVQTASAEYIVQYCQTYKDIVRKDPELLLKLRTIVSNGISASGSKALSANDLRILVALPREVFACQGGDSVINSIPPRRTHPELLRALAAFFGTNSPDKKDRAAARASYFLYCERYPNMWRLIVQASDTVANLELALTANEFMQKIINAEWEPLPSEPSNEQFALPTESWLTASCNDSQPLPTLGIDAIFMGQTAAAELPYLLKPARSFSGFGDEQSAAWKVANAKYDVLKQFLERLKNHSETKKKSPDMQTIVETVERRVAEGPMGAIGGVGGEVGTMRR